MKSNAQPSPYFSKAPLKALQQEPAKTSATYQSPYLRSVLSGNSPNKNVFSLSPINAVLAAAIRPFTSRLPKDIELTEREWFNNYE